MAITIDTPGGGLIGPTITITVRSDVVGPIPPNSDIQITIFPEGIEQPCGGWSIPISASPQLVKLTQQHYNVQTLFATVADGGRVTVKTEIHSTAGTFDEGTTTGLTWSTTGLISEQLRELQQTVGEGGFTEDDRAQLQQLQLDTSQILANWAQYTSVTLPSLNDVLSIITEAVHTTLDFAPEPIRLALGEIFNITNPSFWEDRDLSGGTTCQRVDYDASFNALFGVTVVVDVVPDDWVFQTPDHAWGFHDLAVLTFLRGGQVTERHGIHNRSHSVSPLPDFPFPWQSTIPIAFQPGDTHITVDWAPGVCGRLIGHVLP